jgi:hypothetical protein
VRPAEPGEQQPQVRPGVGDRADRRAGVAADPALVDHDHRGQAADLLDVRPGPPGQPVARERRIGLVELIARLGGDRVEHQRRLARSGDADEDDQPIARNIKINIDQVVRTGAAKFDRSL